MIVGQGRNWKIPAFWPILLRYISAPILAIIYGFAYPAFYQLRYDPLHIAGFTLAHFALVIILSGLIIPRWYNIFIPLHRQGEGDTPTRALETKGEIDGDLVRADRETLGFGSSAGDASSEEEKAHKSTLAEPEPVRTVR